MKFLKQGVCLALLGAGLAAAPGIQATAAGHTPSVAGGSLVQQMKTEARGSVALSAERATGKIGFIRATGNGDLMPSREGGSLTAAAAKASAYLDRYASAFGATPDQLKQSGARANKYGWTVSYVQQYKGLPVFGSTLRVNFDKAGDLTAVNGYAAPGLDLATTPRFSASDAAARAIAVVKADPPGTGEGNHKVDTSGLKATQNQLVVYRLGAVKGEPGKAVLAYVVEVSNNKNIRDMVFVDAGTGKFVNRYSMVDDALTRHLQEAAGSSDPSTFTNVWNEGEAFPGALNQDQQNEVQGTGDAYWFFNDTFGRDSYDGAGHDMTTVNNDGRIDCPNANWNGTTTNYCDGVTSDDVVAHEWGHAYTEYTSGLIYQWQSGALNESYSDIWGETVDLINGRLDEGEGDLTAKRPVGLCSTHSPANPVVTINSPASIAKSCLTGGASYGPQLDGTGLTNDVVVGLDDNADGGTTTDGCTALTNAAAVAGKFVLVDRGTCSFTTKTQTAQDAGAAAVIIGNRDDSAISPSGAGNFTIPTVTIGLTDRELIKSTLAGGSPVNVTMKDASGNRFDSYRWLMGEKSPAFGGAIRDMWNPTCYGDPGKVSDAEYKCSTDDNGGVHGNSGVPNHSYALLVDGGTFNGVPVVGIGLDKAANIYFHAQTTYLTPMSDFSDLADSLAASCKDLVGQPINRVQTTANGTPVAATSVTAADCEQVAAMSNAVELRQAPAQCNFQPLLQPNAPAACGAGYKTNVVWKEGFDSGLDGWTTDQELTYPVGHGVPWQASTSAPGGHAGGVAFAPDPSTGSCGADANDISSRDSIVSPIVSIPGSHLKSPRLSFDHYVASEGGWDGGNVKIKVDGARDWTQIPNSAYVFNAPNSALNTAAAGNTGPMAGQAAFTGTDGGEVTGSWGQSQIDLTKVGVTPGSDIQLRFDFGRDGCGGVDGWYVDNVMVSTCKLKAKLGATNSPKTAAYGTASTVHVAVAGDGSLGSVPSGVVKLRDAAGNLVGSGLLTDGAASIALPADLTVGAHALTIDYSGDNTFAAESTGATATVAKARSHTVGTRPSPVHRTQTIIAQVKVTAAGVTPTGMVKVYSGRKLVGRGTVIDGIATVRITKDFPAGLRGFRVNYLGSDTVSTSLDRFKVRIIK